MKLPRPHYLMAAQELPMFPSTTIYPVLSEAKASPQYYTGSDSPFEPPSSSFADSDSIISAASLSESEQGSQQSDHHSTSSLKSTKSKSAVIPKEIRAVHNVSEQHRRKYLKSCFESLQREAVSERATKVSHLLILTSALSQISELKNQQAHYQQEKERTSQEFHKVRDQLEQLSKEFSQKDPSFDVKQFLEQSGLGPVDITSAEVFQKVNRLFIADSEDSQASDNPSESAQKNGTKPKRSSKMTSSTPRKPSARKSKQPKSTEVVAGVSTESVDGESDLKSESETPSLNGTNGNRGDQPLMLRILEETDDPAGMDDSSAPPTKKAMISVEGAKRVNYSERRRLAEERNLPLHLANGVPTLSGGNYWTPSIGAFPSFPSRFRSAFSRRKYHIIPTEFPKPLPPVRKAVLKKLSVSVTPRDSRTRTSRAQTESSSIS